ncbi:unnamed protein product [Colias eurytheme]|nr:unnamed protein product [Colias eurytheme]
MQNMIILSIPDVTEVHGACTITRTLALYVRKSEKSVNSELTCVGSTVSRPRGIDILLAAPPAAPRRPPAPHHPPTRHYSPNTARRRSHRLLTDSSARNDKHFPNYFKNKSSTALLLYYHRTSPETFYSCVKTRKKNNADYASTGEVAARR